MTRYACEECGGPLERGRCEDRECRELAVPDPFAEREYREALNDVIPSGLPDELELPPPADPRSVLP